MLDLREYARRPRRLADFLPWAALVAPGVVLNKDGSFQRSARFRGPDLDSAMPSELVAAAGRLNNSLRRLGSGWALFVEARRDPAAEYPDSRFPDPVSALVEAERRAAFEAEGAHYESAYFLTLAWMPPAEEARRIERWLYDGRPREHADGREHLPFVPGQGECLYRACLLRSYLAGRGLGSSWVFGVRTWPFAAHCWLQCGDLVLDDDPDRVALYTPILVVSA